MTTLYEPSQQDPAATAGYRQHRRAIWQMLRVHHADTLAEAQARGFGVDVARRAAGISIRGETRSWMSELLTRATVPALAEFLAGGQSWGQSGEHLMDHSDAVVRLIDHSYPLPTWTVLGPLAPAHALDDGMWSQWVHIWREQFGAVARSSAAPPTTEEDSMLRRWAPWITSAAVILGATTIVVVATRE